MTALENTLSKIIYHKHQMKLALQSIKKLELIAEKITNGEYKDLGENLVFMFKQSLEFDSIDKMFLDLIRETRKNINYEKNVYFFMRYHSASEIQMIAYDKENDISHIAAINEWCFSDMEEIIKTFTELSIEIFNTINYLLHETELIPPEERYDNNYESYKAVVSNFLENEEHEISFGLNCIRMTKDNKIAVLTDALENEEIKRRNIILTNSFRSIESQLKKKPGSSLIANISYYSMHDGSYKRFIYQELD